MIFSIFDKISPLYSVAVLSIAIFVSIFFGMSRKMRIKKFVVILAALSLFLALFVNIYSFATWGSFSNYLMSFEVLQVIEISIILFSALNILFFISIHNIGNEHFVKILILFIFSICCIIFIVISRNFLLMFLSWCIFLISIFQLVTSLNIRSDGSVKYILRFFISSLLAGVLVFFGFSIIYGSTDFINFKQIVQSEAISSPLTIAGIIIFIIAVYLYLFLFPFQGPYLKLIKRCEHSSMAVIWFLYFPAGIFVLVKLNEVIYYLIDSYNFYMTIVFIVLAFICMIFSNIGAVSTKSMRRILSFLFLFFIGIYLLSYAELSADLISKERQQWLNITNLFMLVVSFLPVYSIAASLEKSTGSDSILNMRGFLRNNTYLGINLIIILLSWCGAVGTIGYVNRFYYIEPFILCFRRGNLSSMGVLKLIIFAVTAVSFIFLAVNIFRLIVIQFFKSNGEVSARDKNSIVFAKFYYIYISFFTIIILAAGILGLLEILNVDVSIFGFRITDCQFLNSLQ